MCRKKSCFRVNDGRTLQVDKGNECHISLIHKTRQNTGLISSETLTSIPSVSKMLFPGD